jgi:hypothetical protein
MSVSELADIVRRRGIRCREASKRHYVFRVDGVTWSAFERHDGGIRLRCDTRLTPEEAARLTVHTCLLKVSGDGIVGMAKCGACDGRISPYDAYCRHCGARVVGGW